VLNYGNATLIHTTVTGNSAPNGGGLYTYGTLTLAQTLISGNVAQGSGQEIYNGGGAINGSTHNLLGHNGLDNAQAFQNYSPDPSDRTATSDGTHPTALAQILNPTLADNGAPSGHPTLTHALLPGSPALDAGHSGGLSTDQRGGARAVRSLEAGEVMHHCF
jgi:predicted outer membrane repeat protein